MKERRRRCGSASCCSSPSPACSGWWRFARARREAGRRGGRRSGRGCGAGGALRAGTTFAACRCRRTGAVCARSAGRPGGWMETSDDPPGTPHGRSRDWTVIADPHGCAAQSSGEPWHPEVFADSWPARLRRSRQRRTVAPGGFRRLLTRTAAPLKAAASRGARRFLPTPGSHGCAAQGSGEPWRPGVSPIPDSHGCAAQGSGEPWHPEVFAESWPARLRRSRQRRAVAPGGFTDSWPARLRRSRQRRAVAPGGRRRLGPPLSPRHDVHSHA